MSTAEDVFALYEKQDSYKSIVLPITIGDSSTPCRFKTKCYICPGEECAICLEKIMSKKEAYLTGCGHSFHRECLLKTFESKWKQKLYCTLKCPLCRCNLGLPSLFERYSYQDTKPNYLDGLENFWITKDLIMPHFCTHTKEGIHYLGMKNTCCRCKGYLQC
jgi:hypothetical protein